MMKLLFIALYAAISASGVALIKVAFTHLQVGTQYQIFKSLAMDWRFFCGVGLYGSGFLMWMFILSRNALSWIFPIAASALIVATYIIGILFLKEELVFSRIIGILIIIAGIFILNYR